MHIGHLIRHATLLATVVGCGTQSAPPSKPAGKPPGWSAADLVDWRYAHRTGKESIAFRFRDDGTVDSILSKDERPDRNPNEPPEAPVAPLFYWSIDANGTLHIGPEEGAKDAGWHWSLVSLDETSAQVLWNPKPTTFTRERVD